MKKITYSNATEVKIPNSRIIVSKGEKSYTLGFRIFDDKTANEPRALHKTKRSKIAETYLKITKPAAKALLIALTDEINRVNETEYTK